MTQVSGNLNLDQSRPGPKPWQVRSAWIIALGVIYVIAGIIALGSMLTATVASVLVVGTMMMIVGLAEIVSAFQLDSWSKTVLWGLIGVLYVVAGFVTFENPLLAAAFLTLVLGVSLTASGLVRIVLAFGMKHEAPWVWIALSGLVTFLLGLIILSHWPIDTLYVLGLFLGIDLIVAGAGWLGIGFGLRER
ncbi:HdeD family acid-resistance protein [Bradyrhizobium sp. WD16]|uniref:HdeD family acid-resistance protein n=1 Tax=Bradyrhizobium sp. WD16 TaxID=1521768 RepID=UPI0020A30B0D|nr:HdeD family acid-resistance protein [Bradyrhizobium sp. WD16]UTD26728.1 hypothetical protein DB459_07145 [Bradyrhizobium sp. WD16]